MPASPFSYVSDELDAMVAAENYYSEVLRSFAPYLGGRVMEVGAGIGTFAARLQTVPAIRELTLLEPAVNNAPVLRARFASDARIRVANSYLDEVTWARTQDALVAVNVLEHVRDDDAFLRAAFSTIVPGGALLLFVPALQILYGSLDRAFEHHRRYRRRELRTQVERAGFTIETLRYSNLVGVLAWFVSARVLGRRTVGAGEVRLYDRLILSWLSRVERRVAPPVGQSLVLIARR